MSLGSASAPVMGLSDKTGEGSFYEDLIGTVTLFSSPLPSRKKMVTVPTKPEPIVMAQNVVHWRAILIRPCGTQTTFSTAPLSLVSSQIFPR
jgi:hypothetical protein